MRYLQQILSTHGLKGLLAIKILVISYVLVDKGYLQWGERQLGAQNNQSETPGTAEEANNPKTAKLATGDSPLASEPGSQDNSQDASADIESKLVSNRKSYLEDLLELPKIDSQSLKKTEVSRYLSMFEKKQAQVNERLAILESREESLKKLESSIEGKIKNLEEEIKFFDSTLQKEKDIAQKRLDQLLEFYQKMDAKRAAPIFEAMDRDLVVALFKAMPQKQTMNILGLMNPQKSVELTEYFGRIRSGKEYELLVQINKSLRDEFQECKGLPNDASNKESIAH